MNSTYFLGLVSGGAMALAALGSVACGSSSDGASGGAGGHTGGVGGGQNLGGASGSGMAGSGAAGTAGSAVVSGGSGGSGDAGPLVRVDNTDGVSVLDMPSSPVFAPGACDGNSVACNGMCLTMDGQSAGTCTALKLGLGQTTSLYLNAQSLFYTAANQEILKYDLASKTHTSFVRGLDFVQALAGDDTTLYFGTEAPDSFFEYDVRSIPLAGGDITVIAPETHDPPAEILPLSDKVLFGRGNFEPLDLFTVPKTGGQATSYAGIRGYNLVIDGTTLYYLAGDFGGELGSTSVAAPAAGNLLNKNEAFSRFVLDAGFLYQVDETNNYLRTSVAGGAGTPVQQFPTETYLIGRTPTQVLLGQDDTTAKLTHVLAMPLAGGTAKDLVTVEYQELKAVTANATNVYLAVGISHAGAILDVKLP